MTENALPSSVYAERLHTYLRAIPAAIDVKVSIWMATSIGVILFAARTVGPDPVSNVGVRQFKQASSVLSIFGVALLILSIVCAVAALWARTKIHNNRLFSAMSISASSTIDEFLETSMSFDVAAFTEAQFSHCYELADIITNKIKWLNRSLLVGVPGILVTAFATILGSM